jgi:hypothetical protein
MKKKRRDRSVFRCRASVSRARRREERRVWSDGWMDELSTTGRDGTGRGRRREDANDRLTMRARGDADGAILLLRRERGFHAQR